MAETVGGYLKIGMNENGEIVMEFDDMRSNIDENGVGHVIFSTAQARALANLLNNKADEADRDNAWRRG